MQSHKDDHIQKRDQPQQSGAARHIWSSGKASKVVSETSEGEVSIQKLSESNLIIVFHMFELHHDSKYESQKNESFDDIPIDYSPLFFSR